MCCSVIAEIHSCCFLYLCDGYHLKSSHVRKDYGVSRNLQKVLKPIFEIAYVQEF